MSIASLKLQLSIESAEGPQQAVGRSYRWAPASLVANGKREKVSLTQSAFTALSPPTGAVAVLIFPPVTAVSLTLKGITGDTGISIVPASGYKGIPLLLPLSSPSIGIANGDASAHVVELIWL